LTAKQEAFVREYLIDLNATQAAIRAGYSEKTAGATGFENLKKPEIASAIAAAQQVRSVRTEITQDRVLKEIARVAFGDPRDVMTWGPGGVVLKDSATLTDDQAMQVAEVSETTSATGGSLKLKKHDKVKALELLGRHLGMFTDKTELSGAEGGPLTVVVRRFGGDA
jgi:phage terminase small subunit